MNEVLFMEARVFSEFISRFKMKPKNANQMFEEYDIWKHIEDCYDTLHMSGDEYIVNEIVYMLRKRGALA